ncbi:hypothetical protein STENM223S_08630 [Streptomyces tendae]
MRGTDVFFVLDKGEAKADLTGLRRDMLRTHLADRAVPRRRGA